MNKTTFKFFALGGILGPALFTTVTLVGASLRPDYNHISMFISELGATGTSNALFMNIAGFMLTGVMIVAFGLALVLFFPNRPITGLGSALIIVFGLGFLLVGNFSCDEGCPPEGSLENTIHDRISGLMFLSAIIGILLLGISFRNLDLWRGLWVFSVVSALLSFGFVIALINSFESYVLTGIWQRLLIITIFVWCGIVGLRIFKFSLKIDTEHP